VRDPGGDPVESHVRARLGCGRLGCQARGSRSERPRSRPRCWNWQLSVASRGFDVIAVEPAANRRSPRFMGPSLGRRPRNVLGAAAKKNTGSDIPA
jgi:hypothetical protein